MVKLHGQCNAPGEVIGVTLKCRGGRGEKSDEKHRFHLYLRYLTIPIQKCQLKNDSISI